MKKPKVFVTRRIPEDGFKFLREYFEIETSDYDGVITKDLLIKNINGVDGILSLLTDSIDKDVMDSAGPQLKVVSNYAVGYNNIDVEEATKGIS